MSFSSISGFLFLDAKIGRGLLLTRAILVREVLNRIK